MYILCLYLSMRFLFKNRIVFAGLIGLLSPAFITAQRRDLPYYESQAEQASPALKEIYYRQKISSLQKDLVLAPYKPKVFASADYLFAPFFFNHGAFITLGQDADKKAFGYDAGITNGGLYAAQINVS